MVLLAPSCKPGVALLDPICLSLLLDGKAPTSSSWSPALKKDLILLPVVRLGHWFLLKFDLKEKCCTVYNSLQQFAEGEIPGLAVRALQAISGPHWSLERGFSPAQADSSSCGVFTLLNIMSLSLKDLGGDGLPPLRSGWPTFFRIHWLSFLAQAGVYATPLAPRLLDG
jgi:hypothetical protein